MPVEFDVVSGTCRYVTWRSPGLKSLILASRAQARPYRSPISGDHAVAANERTLGCNDAGREMGPFHCTYPRIGRCPVSMFNSTNWIIGEDDIPVRWCQSIVILSPLSLSFPPLQRIRPSWPTDGEPTFAADCCHAISYDRLNEPGETSEDVFLGSVPFRSFGAQNQCLSWQGDLDSFRIGRL